VDLALVRDFLSRAASASPPQYYAHPGDVLWLLHRDPAYDPRSEVRLWEDGGGLVGFAWLEEPDGVVMQVRPDLRGRGPVEEEMLRWAAGRLADPRRNPGGELWTRALSEDARLDALLLRLGFARDPDHALKMHRPLGPTIPQPRPPQGWTVRPIEDGDRELEKRLALHHAVWPSSRMTPGAYRSLREAPGYAPELDLVAVGPDGSFGAYCLCWPDPASGVGLFEPLGTHPDFRGRGLGRAVMVEGLRRLRASGAEAALVTAFSANEAAAGLYRSVGFRTVGREHLYGKNL
jgi:mycothiol synthase